MEQDPDTGDSEKCGLHADENHPRLIAFERVYNGLTTVHNVPLSNDKVKVSVKEVRDVEARVPVPSQEVWLVG